MAASRPASTASLSAPKHQSLPPPLCCSLDAAAFPITPPPPNPPVNESSPRRPRSFLCSFQTSIELCLHQQARLRFILASKGAVVPGLALSATCHIPCIARRVYESISKQMFTILIQFVKVLASRARRAMTLVGEDCWDSEYGHRAAFPAVIVARHGKPRWLCRTRPRGTAYLRAREAINPGGYYCVEYARPPNPRLNRRVTGGRLDQCWRIWLRNSLVRSSLGLLKKTFGVASSTI